MGLLNREIRSPYNFESVSDGYATVNLSCATTYMRARAAGRIDQADIDLVVEKFELGSEEALFLPENEDFMKSAVYKLILNDFYSFALFSDLPVDKNELYKEIIDTMFEDEAESNMTALFIPRGHLKSTILMNYGAWLYLRSTSLYNVAPRILLIHNSKQKNQENLDLVKKFLALPQVLGLFFNQLQMIRNNLDVLNFRDNSPIQRKEPIFSTAYVGERLEGKHFGVVLGDDIVNQQSDDWEAAEQVKSWMDTLPPLYDSARKGGLRMHLVGTEYSKISYYQTVVRKGAYKVISIPLEDENGDSNFPERTSKEDIAILKKTYSTNMRFYESQYNMIPYKTGDSSFSFGIDKLPLYKPNENDIIYTVLTFDPAISKKKRTSTAVLLLIRFHSDGLITVDKGWGDNINKSPNRLMERVARLVRTYDVDKLIIEKIAYQESLVVQVKDKFTETGIHIPVIGHVHKDGKEEHILTSLLGLVESERILVNPYLNKLVYAIEESEVNDWIDALSFISEIPDLLLNYKHYSIKGQSSEYKKPIIVNGVRLKRVVNAKHNFDAGIFGY